MSRSRVVQTDILVSSIDPSSLDELISAVKSKAKLKESRRERKKHKNMSTTSGSKTDFLASVAVQVKSDESIEAGKSKAKLMENGRNRQNHKDGRVSFVERVLPDESVAAGNSKAKLKEEKCERVSLKEKSRLDMSNSTPHKEESPEVLQLKIKQKVTQ